MLPEKCESKLLQTSCHSLSEKGPESNRLNNNNNKKKQALMKCPKSEIQNPKNAISRKQAMESPRKKTEEKNKTEDEPVWFTTKCEQRG